MKKTILIMYIVLSAFSLFSEQNTADQSQWSAVMAGETLCDPVLHGEYLYTLSSDKAINCIDYTGSFIWRRNIERTVNPFLVVTRSGILLVADSSGLVQAVSSQGIYLWALRLPEPVVYAPYGTSDGRICLLTKSCVYCLSVRGKIKWQLQLPAAPARQICETGTASLLLVLSNKDFCTIDRSGKLLNNYRLKKEISTLISAPEGYIVSTTDGVLTYYRTNVLNSTAQPVEGIVWESKEPPPLFMQCMESNVLCAYADGTVSLRSIENNTLIWKIKLSSRLNLPFHCIKADDDYYLSCRGFAAAVSGTGTVKREKTVAAVSFLPLVTPRGILVAVEDWVVNSWQLDTKIMTQNPQSEPPAVYYPVTEIHKQSSTLPFFIPYNDCGALLAEIEKNIIEDTLGEREADYVLFLQTILANSEQVAYFPYDFTIHERALAAELLGRLESLEYRDVLLVEAQKTVSPVLAAALMRGLGYIASDPDGRSIDSIQLLLNRCGIREWELAYIACDSFAEIAKYGDTSIARKALKALFTIMASAFPEKIKQYARQKIKTIVE